MGRARVGVDVYAGMTLVGDDVVPVAVCASRDLSTAVAFMFNRASRVASCVPGTPVLGLSSEQSENITIPTNNTITPRTISEHPLSHCDQTVGPNRLLASASVPPIWFDSPYVQHYRSDVSVR